MTEQDFTSVVDDLLFSYNQFILNGFLHRDVSHGVYERNRPVWNNILLGLENNAIVGLARLLDDHRAKDFGRPFDEAELNPIREKIINIRHAHIAHLDLSVKRNMPSFLAENQLSGSELVKMFAALQKRALGFQKAYDFKYDVQAEFSKVTNTTLNDLAEWLKYFA